MKGNIFAVKHFAVHDGNGIRTTVFFKGCSLKCVWCHNPEGINPAPQMAYYSEKCILCGECATACKQKVHIISKEGHNINKENCIFCRACENVCLEKAIEIFGKEISVAELLPQLTQDRDFYKTSNGGITLSGGECLLQADFCRELLFELKKENIHTAVDTCGFVPQDAFDKVMPYTDIFLYDIKAIDDDVHKKCSGHSNKPILENLKYIDKCGSKTEIRIPYVPGYNSGQIKKIGEFLSTLKNITFVKVLPYHNFAGSKYEALGIKNTLPPSLPADEEIINAKNILASFNLSVLS